MDIKEETSLSWDVDKVNRPEWNDNRVQKFDDEQLSARVDFWQDQLTREGYWRSCHATAPPIGEQLHCDKYCPWNDPGKIDGKTSSQPWLDDNTDYIKKEQIQDPKISSDQDPKSFWSETSTFGLTSPHVHHLTALASLHVIQQPGTIP